MYAHYAHWESLVESEHLMFLTLDGEEVYFYDVMVGMCTLPPRQKEAFTLHVLQGYSEKAAAEVMFPNSKWSTPVQQYSNIALKKMVEAYDNWQAGIPPVPYGAVSKR